MSKEKFIEIVKSQNGMRFKHQGRVLNVGLDCAGLVIASLKECGYDVSDAEAYARNPSYDTFLKYVDENCVKISKKDVQIGDFVIHAFQSEPQHISVVTSIIDNEIEEITHALMTARCVITHYYDEQWIKNTRGFYRFKAFTKENGNG